MQKNKNTTYDKGLQGMNNTRRIRASEVEESRFYKMPKWLIHDERFKGLNNDAKILYMIMRDRHELSLKNKWIDDDGCVYMIFSRESMCEHLGVSMKPVIKAVKDLIKFGLIDEVRQGCNKPNILYVLTVDLDSQWKCRNDISENGDIPYPNMVICQPNDTNNNKTNLKENKDDDKEQSSIIIDQTLIDSFSKEWKTQTSKPILLSIKQKQKLQHLISEYGYRVVVDVLAKVKESKYLTSNMTINHFLNVDTFIKIANDTYKDHKAVTKAGNSSFTNMYSHEWDLDELEQQAVQHFEDEFLGE